MAKSKDLRNQIADRYAIGEDLEHVVRCAEQLLNPIAGYDAIYGRALWQSALISLRRASANASTMGPDSGGITNPVSRSNSKHLLPAQLVEPHGNLLQIADKVVAHRNPIDGQREMKVHLGNDGSFAAVSYFAMPTNPEIEQLKEIAEVLFNAAIRLDSIDDPWTNGSDGQHGFYARPSAHLRPLATLADFGTISRSSRIVRFV